mmetsp:Transcript_12785/g.37108  ORF Transcript_12785/g.37108 Transcript_12785/m.37108 type:complete len:214 (-) Transcript_12785:44-685(-)
MEFPRACRGICRQLLHQWIRQCRRDRHSNGSLRFSPLCNNITGMLLCLAAFDSGYCWRNVVVWSYLRNTLDFGPKGDDPQVVAGLSKAYGCGTSCSGACWLHRASYDTACGPHGLQALLRPDPQLVPPCGVLHYSIFLLHHQAGSVRGLQRPRSFVDHGHPVGNRAGDHHRDILLHQVSSKQATGRAITTTGPVTSNNKESNKPTTTTNNNFD